MAKVTLIQKDTTKEIEDIENLEGPSANFPYWQVTLKRDGVAHREFYHERIIDACLVEGEEELIENAQTKGPGDLRQLMRQLGMED